MKKLSLFTLCVIFSMFFVVSCGTDEEDAVDTETGDTQSDTGTTDSDTDTTDTTNPTDDPTNPTDDPTNPTDDPANPTDDPTNPTDEPTDDPTDTDPSYCGNGTREEGEKCDGGTNDCTLISPTYSGGHAYCKPDCSGWDESTCQDPTDPTEPTTPGEGSDGNLNTGDTSGNQAQNGAVGAACTSDSQCTGTYSGSYGGESYDVEAFCLTANDSYFPAPGGYCTFNCDSTDHQACDSAGEVYHGYNGWGDGYCFHRCTKPSDCRVGYRCSNKIHACLPDCATAGCETGTCDETDKVCL